LISVSDYYQVVDGLVSISEQQASDFAKGEAGDFNPIHTVGNARFCVPGDLLFAVLLERYGVYSKTQVQFTQMVSPDTALQFPDGFTGGELQLHDVAERHCLTMHSSGKLHNDAQANRELTAAYVRFSGQTFPDILLPLMANSGVMINPARPLVIYKDMMFSLSADLHSPIALVLADSELVVDGRKGMAHLRFSITSGGVVIGEGEKNMVLSGLREYDAQVMDDVVAKYNESRMAYQGQVNAL